MSDNGLNLRMTAGGWRLEASRPVEGARAPPAPSVAPRVLTSNEPMSPDLAPAAVLCWDDFASPAARDAWFEHICAAASTYEPSRVYGANVEAAVDEVHRKSMVNRNDSWIRESILPQLENPVRVARRYYGMDGIPFGRTEIQVTASGEGDFFKVHCDDGPLAAYYSRMLTFVYYLHRHPRPFSGGELRVFDSRRVDGRFRQASSHVAIEPRDNRLVIFPSDRYHEVTRVDGSTPAFEDRRITVNGWYWAKDGVLPPPATEVTPLPPA